MSPHIGLCLAPGDVVNESRYVITKQTISPTSNFAMLFCPKGFYGTLVAPSCDCCAWILFDRPLLVQANPIGRRLPLGERRLRLPVQIGRKNIRRLSLLELIAEAAAGVGPG